MDGMSRTTTLSSQVFHSGASVVASLWAKSMAIWEAAISVEWMVAVIRTNTRASDIRSAASAGSSPSGAASRRLISMSRGRFSMFRFEEMKARISGNPRVDLPSSVTLTRADSRSSRVK